MKMTARHEKAVARRRDSFRMDMATANTPVKKLAVASDYLRSAAQMAESRDSTRVAIVLTPVIHAMCEAAADLLTTTRSRA